MPLGCGFAIRHPQEEIDDHRAEGFSARGRHRLGARIQPVGDVAHMLYGHHFLLIAVNNV